MNLLERRKIETRRLIQQSALELVRDQGIEAATVEAICEAAGISQRTFFNYFAFKEAVFIVSPEPLPAAAVERFLAAPGDLMDDLIDLMVAHAVLMQRTRQEGLLMREMMLTGEIAKLHPRLMPLQMAEFHKFDRQLQEAIAQRLGLPDDDAACAALAGAVLGANRKTVDLWMEDQQMHLPTAIQAGIKAMVRLVRNVPDPTQVEPATTPSG